MKILIIAPFFPYPLDQGGKIRVFNLIERLASRHEITLACLSPTNVTEYGSLPDHCKDVVVIERKQSFPRDFVRFIFSTNPFNCIRFSSSRFAEKLQELLTRETFDLVQVEFSMMWQYAPLFAGTPTVLDAHNIEHRNVQQLGMACKSPLRRWLYLLEERKLRRAEEKAWRECALCFAVSGRERDEIAACTAGPTKVVTAPNGVDPERFAFRPKRVAGRDILFLGGMDYSPNLDAARYFLGDIFPLVHREIPDVKLLMVGRELWRLGGRGPAKGKAGKRESGESVELFESVSDILPWFYKADLLAVSLRQGAGTRIKVLEAMAAGLPVVTTEKGCEGLDVRAGEHVMVADTPEAFAAAVTQVMTNTELREKLTQNARYLVEEKYSWDAAAKAMEDAYQRIWYNLNPG